jgi:hypothetical protein
MNFNSSAFGLSLTCLLAVPLASCSTPNSETVPARPAVQTEPAPAAAATPTPEAPEASEAPASEKAPEAAAAMPVEAPAASSTEVSSEASKPAEAQPAAEVPASDTKPVAEAATIVVTPAATTPAPIQPVRPEAQKSQSVGPTIGISKPVVEDTKTSIFGEPLYVDGKRVTDNQIKLYLCYGPGRMLFEMARNGVIIEDEMRRQAADATEAEIKRRETEKPFGSPDARKAAWDGELKIQLQQLKEKYTVTDAEVQKEVDRMDNDFKKNYPALDLDTEVNRSFRNKDWYRSQLRQTQLFDKVFIPLNPDEWPAVTSEAVRADSGDVLIADAHESYTARKAAAEKNGIDLPPEDPLYLQMMRDLVRSAVFKMIDFKTPGDGLPDSIALWADTDPDGKPELVLSTDELYDQVKATISQTEIDEAKQWFVTSIATRDRLEKDGFLLNPDDCRAAVAAKMSEFENSNYNLENLATSTYYFPSLDTYREYFCMLEGFTKMSAPKLQAGPGGELSQTLRDYFERCNKVMGLGQVDVEVMLIGAFDPGRFRWKQNGWEWAKNKSAEIYKQVVENTTAYNEQRAKILEAKAKGQDYKPEKDVPEPYRFWSQMMDDHCEYWDPPAPETGKVSAVGMKMKGRFGPHYRNDLSPYIGETYFTEWVTGNSITDHVFFDQPEGSVEGPFKGPQGYYITRVLRRTPPSRGLNLGEPKHLELLRQDWLRTSFIKYAKEAVAQADVKGFPKS